MNKILKTIASTVAAFAMLVSALVAPISTNVAVAQTTSETTEVTSVSASQSHSSYTSCELSASRTDILVGEDVTLNWDTSGFDKITINGEVVSGDKGSKVISSLLLSTNFKLEATNDSGSKCTQEVYVNCKPPVVEECKLEIEKSVNKSSAATNEEITYTIEIENIGNADCTGGGVKIEDKVDHNITYLNNQLTGEVSEGYGSKSVYTDSDRTLRFNAHTLVPGESASIKWTGKINTPNQCGDFEVTNQAKVTAKELNNFGDWVYSETVKTAIDNDCDTPDPIVRPTCPYTAADGIVVNFGDERLLSRLTIDEATTANYPTAVPAGNYEVKLVAWDGYENRINALQHNEQYNVVFENSNGVVATSGDTEDLEDNVVSATFIGQVNKSLTLNEEVTNVYAKNSAYPDKSSGNSVVPICAVFIPEEVPEKPVKPVCPYTAADGIVVDFGDARLRSDKDASWSVTTPIATNLPVGNYEVKLVAWDGYLNRVNNNQPHEQYRAVVANADGVVVETNDTGDLADNVISAIFNGEVNSALSVTSAGTEVYARHSVYPDKSSANSLNPICAVFIPEEVTVPSCDMFTATPNTITVGDSTTLEWKTTNAVSVGLNTVGEVSANGSIEVAPLADTVYKLDVFGVDDQMVSCEVPVTVSEDPVPVCKAFNATPDLLPVGGGDVVLEWETEQATAVTISPTIGVVDLTGNTSINLTESTDFTLTATDDNGDEVTCPVSVVVPDPEPLTCENNVSFSVSDSSITRGQEVTLDWNTTNVYSVSIDQIDATTLSGTETVSPSSDITYTLTATKGTESVNCPVSVDVSSGGGGGGGSSLRCDLDISDTKIKVGEEITLTWDTSRATEVTLTDDRGTEIFSTDNFLASEKKDYYDGSITLKPTRDTEYTLLAERGSSDKECEVEVEIEGEIVVLQTRDQQPLVAGISLSQVPYTGFEAGPFMTIMFYALLVAWAFYVTYLVVIRKRMVTNGLSAADNDIITDSENVVAMKQAEALRPDLFATANSTQSTAPVNLPVEVEPEAVVEEAEKESVLHVSDATATDLENRAHAQKTLLSSDAIRYFIGATESEAKLSETLDVLIAEAKKTYPLEDGWVVINESRMQNLCEETGACASSIEDISFAPNTVPEGAGSLAEAIVTGNIIAAYEMIGNRPMVSLAAAAADLDALYRYRLGQEAEVSEMLVEETKNLLDEQITNMVKALTGAIDGTYTDEASAVKMAIMKAVKEVA